METNSPSPDEAREALAAAREAEVAVRNIPWPLWIYLVNIVLMSVFVLVQLLDDYHFIAHTGVALVIVGVNILAAKHIGIAWALPTSKGYLACVGVAAVFLLIAVILRGTDVSTWATIALAAATALAMTVGTVIHRRSTR